MTFDLKSEQSGIRLSGELSRQGAMEALFKLETKLLPNQTKFILNLSDLVACDSAGVSVILCFGRMIQKRGGQLLISHPPLFFMDLVRVSGLDSVLTWA